MDSVEGYDVIESLIKHVDELILTLRRIIEEDNERSSGEDELDDEGATESELVIARAK